MRVPTKSGRRLHLALLCLLPCLLILAGANMRCLAFQSTSQPAPPATFDLDHDREPIVSLDGSWRFHPGDNSTWADPAFDDSSWPLLRSDSSWSTQGYPGMNGYGWYRFTVAVPANHPPLALELAPIMTSYSIFLDGHPAGEIGSTPPSMFPIAEWEYQVIPLPAPPPGVSDGSLQTIHVAIRVWHSRIWSSYMGGGPMTGGHLLGAATLLDDELRHHEGRRRLLFVDLFSYSIAAFIIGLTIFGLYLFRPKEREYLWFAILLLAKALDAALNIAKEIYAFPSIPIFDLLDGALVACAQAALLLFLCRVLKIRPGRVVRLLLGLAILSPIFGVLYWPGWLSVPVSAVFQILFLLPSSLWMLGVLSLRATRRNLTARLLLLPVLLVQGLYVANNVVIAMNQFGLPIEARFIDTPFIVAPYTMHPAVLAELLFLLAMLAFLIRRFTIARRREERFEGELEAARQVQHVLLPEDIVQVPGFTVDCVYYPAEAVGGDFFQILPAIPATPYDSSLNSSLSPSLSPNLVSSPSGLFVVMGDVAGKGLPAAMMVSVLVGAIRTEATHTSDPATLLTSLNERIFGRSQGGFTTCLCLHITPEGKVTASSAGHLSPYRDGVEVFLEPALPLGIVAHGRYEISTFTLTPGQRLTLVSDGVLEAQSPNGELLGFDRTSQLSTRSAADIAAAAQGFGQNDDITVVTIEFLGSPAAIQQNSASQALAG
jgi:sigma-B regulation protein RsbU (phosphoserine phosphatase)